MADERTRTDGGANGSDDRDEGDEEAAVAVVAGPDEHGIGEELSGFGATVSRIVDVVSTDTLEAAGIGGSDYFVLTDVEEATGIPVAKELNPSVVAVTYAERSLPEFVARVADLAIDPALMGPDLVAEELADTSDGIVGAPGRAVDPSTDAAAGGDTDAAAAEGDTDDADAGGDTDDAAESADADIDDVDADA